ncbi:hypothetical protein GOV14_03040 [Candidatus Pacearchaeota archaeon]|nr:hypothetical protein [Candidatus Pacearchaeota archaeon]
MATDKEINAFYKGLDHSALSGKLINSSVSIQHLKKYGRPLENEIEPQLPLEKDLTRRKEDFVENYRKYRLIGRSFGVEPNSYFILEILKPFWDSYTELMKTTVNQLVEV